MIKAMVANRGKVKPEAKDFTTTIRPIKCYLRYSSHEYLDVPECIFEVIQYFSWSSYFVEWKHFSVEETSRDLSSSR